MNALEAKEKEKTKASEKKKTDLPLKVQSVSLEKRKEKKSIDEKDKQPKIKEDEGEITNDDIKPQQNVNAKLKKSKSVPFIGYERRTRKTSETTNVSQTTEEKDFVVELFNTQQSSMNSKMEYGDDKTVRRQSESWNQKTSHYDSYARKDNPSPSFKGSMSSIYDDLDNSDVNEFEIKSNDTLLNTSLNSQDKQKIIPQKEAIHKKSLSPNEAFIGNKDGVMIQLEKEENAISIVNKYITYTQIKTIHANRQQAALQKDEALKSIEAVAQSNTFVESEPPRKHKSLVKQINEEKEKLAKRRGRILDKEPVVQYAR